ncbi:MAG: DUF1080 domain-containing protein [Dysgonamonadaceae bacterium]|nr:DUF1080 domain-containing protein [Dysgonamonadaceae bacterium]MDD4730080.1 DUF1080 domain-containing protein [Dysgonamonadaceae bacterium]
MKLSHVLIGCIIMLGFSCQSETKDHNILSKTEKLEGWELLFDGETTNGWRFFKGGEVKGWKVEDGILHNSGIGSDHGGDIITTEEFKDFELYLEWRADSLSNSGIFYRVQEHDSIRAIYESGPEYQLGDDTVDKNPNTLCSQLTGANYAMNRPIGAISKPLGEWNTTRIIIKGPHVEHWLNGVKVVEYELWSKEWLRRKELSKWKTRPYYGMSKEGHIGLQDHGGLTSFRNIKIKKL